MTTSYTIYLLNQNLQEQNFWAFLSSPVISNSPTVFANSSTYLFVPGGSTDLNFFTIPVQYVIAAGQSNNAVGLNTVITSNATRNTDLNQLWDVNYAQVPPIEGPTVPQAATSLSTATTVAMRTNNFNPAVNAANGWYQSMGFGVKTAQGFMGVTWDPGPGITYTITPTLIFYIAVGEYSASSLASITAVSNGTAALDTSKDFDAANCCTVTYTATGLWSHVPGRPTQSMLSASREILLASLAD